ncbi:MAG: hypothetical protein JW734_03065 [Candidatus Omnitrophica bacterium]|nr:hypothetical protein [Candidatus Omnitrophota bacterium]
MKNRRTKKLLGTPLQKKILVLFFISAVTPAAIVAVCLYYLIFNLFAGQLAIPEFIAYNVIPVARRVNLIIVISLPIVLGVAWFFALKLSHRITGPLHRLEKELDSRISGKKEGSIHLRKEDEKSLVSLVEKINKLIAKK